MSDYRNINLRAASETGCTTKGSQLLTAEMDETFIELVQYLKDINNPTGVSDYSAAVTYDADKPTLKYVRSNGADGVPKIWKYINSTPASGQTPATSPLYWEEVSIGQIVDQLLTDQTYVQIVEISAAEAGQLQKNTITVVAAPGAAKVIVPLYAVGYNDFNTVAYEAGSDTMDIVINSVKMISLSNSFVEATEDYLEIATAINQARLHANKAMTIESDTNWNTASPDGDGTFKIAIIYKILSL